MPKFSVPSYSVYTSSSLERYSLHVSDPVQDNHTHATAVIAKSLSGSSDLVEIIVFFSFLQGSF